MYMIEVSSEFLAGKNQANSLHVSKPFPLGLAENKSKG